ncbi:class I SAM-dependent methyltransferase [Iamia sp. SCSIO 61187]|nr:class I SAM-dependent methyltransferase [Iamia sp. SCSIO 61187]
MGEVNSTPLKSGICSMILAKDVLEHVSDPIGAMRELRRVAQDNCLLVATVPRAIPRVVWDDPTHVRGFTARAVATLVDSSGWTLNNAPGRIGALPGAGRLRLEGYLETLMRVPGLGHRFGTNWVFRCTPA